MLGPGGVLGFFYPEGGRISACSASQTGLLKDNPQIPFLSVKLWLRFATLWLAVLIVGFAVSFCVLPYGLIWFVGALLLLLVRIFSLRLNKLWRRARSYSSALMQGFAAKIASA